MSVVGFGLVAIKRRWVPEWLWRALGQSVVRRPLRWIVATDCIDEFTRRRVNRRARP